MKNIWFNRMQTFLKISMILAILFFGAQGYMYFTGEFNFSSIGSYFTNTNMVLWATVCMVAVVYGYLEHNVCVSENKHTNLNRKDRELIKAFLKDEEIVFQLAKRYDMRLYLALDSAHPDEHDAQMYAKEAIEKELEEVKRLQFEKSNSNIIVSQQRLAEVQREIESLDMIIKRMCAIFFRFGLIKVQYRQEFEQKYREIVKPQLVEA